MTKPKCQNAQVIQLPSFFKEGGEIYFRRKKIEGRYLALLNTVKEGGLSFFQTSHLFESSTQRVVDLALIWDKESQTSELYFPPLLFPKGLLWTRRGGLGVRWSILHSFNPLYRLYLFNEKAIIYNITRTDLLECYLSAA